MPAMPPENGEEVDAPARRAPGVLLLVIAKIARASAPAICFWVRPGRGHDPQTFTRSIPALFVLVLVVLGILERFDRRHRWNWIRTGGQRPPPLQVHESRPVHGRE